MSKIKKKILQHMPLSADSPTLIGHSVLEESNLQYHLFSSFIPHLSNQMWEKVVPQFTTCLQHLGKEGA